MYNINEPYNSVMYILKPTEKNVRGVIEKIYPKCEDINLKFSCLFKTYGGTQATISSEKEINGLVVVVDTAQIETWYNPDITANCRVAFNNNDVYEIMGNPENINMRNKTMKFKVKKVVGGA